MLATPMHEDEHERRARATVYAPIQSQFINKTDINKQARAIILTLLVC